MSFMQLNRLIVLFPVPSHFLSFFLLFSGAKDRISILRKSSPLIGREKIETDENKLEEMKMDRDGEMRYQHLS